MLRYWKFAAVLVALIATPAAAEEAVSEDPAPIFEEDKSSNSPASDSGSEK